MSPPSLMASRWTRGPDKSQALQPICRNGLLTRYGPTTQEGGLHRSFLQGYRSTPNQITWESQEIALPSNESAVISPYYSGPPIESWEVSPALPSGLQLSDDGTIEGVPDSRTDWSEYTIWGNNSGGSRLAAYGWPSTTSPLIRTTFSGGWGRQTGGLAISDPPNRGVGISRSLLRGGYTSQIPVISASHVGKGKMLGYGHESWVYGSGGVEETAFSLGGVEWVCGKNADVGLAYGPVSRDSKTS